MSEDASPPLGQGIEDAGEALGEQIAAELPATHAEVRAAVPDDLRELETDAGEHTGQVLRAVLADSPLSQYVDREASGRLSSEQ